MSKKALSTARPPISLMKMIIDLSFNNQSNILVGQVAKMKTIIVQ